MISATTTTEVSRYTWSREKGFHMGLIVAVLVAAAAVITPVLAEAPTPISAEMARSYLGNLTVEPESNSPPYDRRLFRHWIGISGRCDTRETVLKRDGVDVVTNAFCTATSGTWRSPYDDGVWTLPSDVDIDHVVPLRQAWVSGARLWTDAQRQDFANDLTRPQLMAVTDNVNQAKGDQDPGQWMPPRTSFHCTYLRAFVQVKHYYRLTVDVAEKSAISSGLAKC
ncbi:hypothetical protein BGZ70_006825 [Mortierella alpina]|uniref:GmrSD restriction endonucleases C-terminal domain-containing protein n=1 Tax=Mortierella alpina TaxID=64518 RepID=A0A9P6J7N7_MORAP|nr:hypothetical protein BGZ70_006825 [Mortierella alpina]